MYSVNSIQYDMLMVQRAALYTNNRYVSILDCSKVMEILMDTRETFGSSLSEQWLVDYRK